MTFSRLAACPPVIRLASVSRWPRSYRRDRHRCPHHRERSRRSRGTRRRHRFARLEDEAEAGGESLAGAFDEDGEWELLGCASRRGSAATSGSEAIRSVACPSVIRSLRVAIVAWIASRAASIESIGSAVSVRSMRSVSVSVSVAVVDYRCDCVSGGRGVRLRSGRVSEYWHRR